METKLFYKEEWLKLAKSGNFKSAEILYYEKLFPEILDTFHSKYNHLFGNDEVLISILGFSPEPIILTAKAVNPKTHYILTTESKGEVVKIIENFLDDEFNLVILKDISFLTIYKSLKEILFDVNDSNIVLDITGGKKSMVSAASIFGKDYGCKITYVDFEEYIKELRKPMPGSEILNIVYDPERDQPELFLK